MNIFLLYKVHKFSLKIQLQFHLEDIALRFNNCFWSYYKLFYLTIQANFVNTNKSKVTSSNSYRFDSSTRNTFKVLFIMIEHIVGFYISF